MNALILTLALMAFILSTAALLISVKSGKQGYEGMAGIPGPPGPQGPMGPPGLSAEEKRAVDEANDKYMKAVDRMWKKEEADKERVRKAIHDGVLSAEPKEYQPKHRKEPSDYVTGEYWYDK